MGKEGKRTPSKSIEKWKEICESWEASGLSQREFCVKENLAVATFQKWLWNLRDQGVVTKKTVNPRHKKAKKPGDFIPIQVASSNPFESPYCILRFQNQGQVIIEKQENIAQLRALLVGLA